MLRKTSIQAGSLVICALITLAPASATGDSEGSIRKIKTRGSATIYVEPDKFALTARVQTTDKDLGHAYELHDEDSAAVLKLASKYGIKPQNVQTTSISVSPIYEGRYSSQPSVKQAQGYLVSKTVTFEFNERKTIAPLLKDVIEAGAQVVSGVTFGSTKMREYRDKARVQAMRAAREKAEQLAQSEGATVGKALEIDETESYGFRGNLSNNVSMSEPQDSQEDISDGIAVGRIPIKGSVRVIFELE